MTTRITDNNLQSLVDVINRTMGTPMTPYKPYDEAVGRAQPNANAYHLSHAYGGVALHKMSSREGCTGVSDVFGCAHMPKRDLYERMHAFLRGVEAKRHAPN